MRGQRFAEDSAIGKITFLGNIRPCLKRERKLPWFPDLSFTRIPRKPALIVSDITEEGVKLGARICLLWHSQSSGRGVSAALRVSVLLFAKQGFHPKALFTPCLSAPAKAFARKFAPCRACSTCRWMRPGRNVAR